MYVIASNGQTWQFHKSCRAGDAFETGLYTTEFLPDLLGALEYACGECAQNVP